MSRFHETGYGKIFYEQQLPRLIRALDKIGDRLAKPVSEDEPLTTVNVLRLKNGVLDTICSFADTPQGNLAAEERYIMWIKEAGIDKALDMTESDIQAAIDNGQIDDLNGNEILISHSAGKKG